MPFPEAGKGIGGQGGPIVIAEDILYFFLSGEDLTNRTALQGDHAFK